MTRKEFELEMLRCLRAHRLRAPQMQEQDAVKFVFQAMLGPGHLLADRDTVTERIAREMDGLTPDPDEPLTEELSPAWCRLNLARAAAEGLEPGTVAGLMASPQDGFRFSRQDVLEACRGLTASGEADPERILDGDWLPSHSEIYRDRYRPAYRVIPAYWIPCMEAVIRISGRKPGTGRTTVTIDGPCASGKTTLASRLAGVFSAGTVHTDDVVIPHRE